MGSFPPHPQVPKSLALRGVRYERYGQLAILVSELSAPKRVSDLQANMDATWQSNVDFQLMTIHGFVLSLYKSN